MAFLAFSTSLPVFGLCDAWEFLEARSKYKVSRFGEAGGNLPKCFL